MSLSNWKVLTGETDLNGLYCEAAVYFRTLPTPELKSGGFYRVCWSPETLAGVKISLPGGDSAFTDKASACSIF